MALYEFTEAGNVVQRHTLDTGSELIFAASDIRRERTGVHARLQILLNMRLLGHDNFNLERDADRLRLANSAHKQLGELDAKAFPANWMKRGLDDFAIDLWDYWLSVRAMEVSDYQYDPTSEVPQLDYILWPHILSGAGTVLFGPPGKGKTWTGLLFSANVEHALTHPWKCERKRRTLYVNLERDQPSMERRARQIYDTLGLSTGDSQKFLHARGRSLADVSDVIRKTVKKEGVELVVLDSISRAGYGDLTENLPANRISDALNSFDCAWVGIGHTPRGDDTHLYGSQMFDAAADVAVALISESTSDSLLGISLQQTKNNHAPLARPEVWAYHFDSDGLSEVSLASSRDFPEIASKQTKRPLERVMEHLLAEGAQTGSQVASALRLDRSHVADMLSRAEQRGELVKTRDGNRVLYGVSVASNTPTTTQGEGEVLLKHLPKTTQHSNTPRVESEEDLNDPCAECGERRAPERYTSDGRPLCASCVRES